MFAISLLAVISLGAFLYIETKAAEPLLPLSLFKSRAFVIAAAIGFIVGMALFGSITLLPVYLQVVKGLDPTSAGWHLTPMMLGVFVSSIASGQIISRIGRYKVFPVMGTGLMTVALVLLSRITVETTAATASVYMLILGLGLGMVMQILVMAVQNAVAYEQLGVATSGTTLFRSIGGAVGAALFGGIFAYTLQNKIAAYVPEAAAKLNDPAGIATLTEPLRSIYFKLFVQSLQPVFITASALAFLAFLLSFAIKEVPLRTSITTEPMNDPFQMPRDATSLEELERIVARITARENRWSHYQRSAERLHIPLEPDEFWMLSRIGERDSPAARAELAKLIMADPQRSQIFSRLAASGMARRTPDGSFELTEHGASAYNRLIRQREDDLRHMLADWDRNEHPDVNAMMRNLAKSFARTPPVKV
jgi:MFS family permease